MEWKKLRKKREKTIENTKKSKIRRRSGRKGMQTTYRDSEATMDETTQAEEYSKPKEF